MPRSIVWFVCLLYFLLWFVVVVVFCCGLMLIDILLDVIICEFDIVVVDCFVESYYILLYVLL